MFASCSLVMGVNYVYMWALFGQVMMAWTGTSTAVNYNHLIIQGVLIFLCSRKMKLSFFLEISIAYIPTAHSACLFSFGKLWRRPRSALLVDAPHLD